MSDIKKIADEMGAFDDQRGPLPATVQEWKRQLDALAAQAGEPVAKVVACPVCYNKEVACDFLDGESSCGDCNAVWNERSRIAPSIISEMQNELDFLRAENETIKKQLHLANVDAWNSEAELNAAPPPAAPVSMAELEKALPVKHYFFDNDRDDYFATGWNQCRAEVLRLASSGVVASVSRESLEKAYMKVCDERPFDPSWDCYVNALRALNIEVQE